VNEEKIGLFGGTFDPVHLGHMQMAEAAMKEFDLDRIAFIPSAQPPHKDTTTISSFAHRVTMLEIACAEKSCFEFNTIEDKLPAPSYTIDTLMVLFEHFGHQSQLFFLIGTDAFLEILTWKEYEKILKLINIIIAPRRGADQSPLADLLFRLGYSNQGDRWVGEGGLKDICFLRAIPDAISSSAIRDKIRLGEDCSRLMPNKVFDYIKSHRLYKANCDKSQQSVRRAC